jgi:hypothetical protein
MHQALPLLLVASGVVSFMYVGFRATGGLAGWARVAGTSIPPVVLAGSVLTFFALAICKEADTMTPSQAATCDTTSSLAFPVAAGYFLLVTSAWLAGLLLRGHLRAREVSLGAAWLAALVPIALALGLWAYVQL